jgi:segregation and condensation protein B
MARNTKPPSPPPSPEQSESATPLSLNRLREAFASMLSPQKEESVASPRSRVSPKLDDGSLGETALRANPCEINPRSVVEAMLFVGRPDDRPYSSREMAAAMRGCSPAEIDAAVAELNAIYERDAAPYEIIGSANGYRLALREALGRMRDKFFGRVREAKLSPATLEILSIVAYNQPITADEVSRLRGAACGAALSTLVRWQLLRLDRPAGRDERPHYSTTDRFLRLFGLENLAALPRSEELEKA